MKRKQIRKKQQEIVKLLHESRLAEALTILKSMMPEVPGSDFSAELEIIETTYKNLLLYSIKGVIDPDKKKIHAQIIKQLLNLSDLVAQHAIMSSAQSGVYQIKNKLENTSRQLKDELYKSLTDLNFEQALSHLLEEAAVKTEESEENTHQKLLVNIFNLVLVTDRMNQKDIDLLKGFFNAEAFSWFEKSTVVSALTLSLIRCFDVEKIFQLQKLYMQNKGEIAARALIGLFMGLHFHNDRLQFYPELDEMFRKLSETEQLDREIEMIAIQFLKSLETESISKKLNEEIIPEVAKFHPKIMDSMDPENMIPGEDAEENNPDWENVFKEAPGLLDKLEEISRMQLEGADVMMNAFSKLKGFGFFNSLINWLMPFSKDHPEVTKGFLTDDTDTAMFLDTITESFYMCNSDKYSFVLQLQFMPGEQKKMMMNMLKSEIENLKEIKKEEEILDQKSVNRTYYMRYIQDLYRFYKLYPQREDFSDFFDDSFEFFHDELFKRLVTDNNIYWNLSQFFFEKKYYHHALHAFKHLIKRGVHSQELYEKTGYCLEKQKKYEQAIDYYQKSELFDSSSSWSVKRIATCYRRMENYEEAARFYHEAASLEPENVMVQTYLGHTYFDLADYENALKHYTKAHDLQPENYKLIRPVSWCLFILGRLDQARYLLSDVFPDEANQYDYMNMGHIDLCSGNKEKALEMYRKSIQLRNNDIQQFIAAFSSDIPFILDIGLEKEIISEIFELLRLQ